MRDELHCKDTNNIQKTNVFRESFQNSENFLFVFIRNSQYDLVLFHFAYNITCGIMCNSEYKNCITDVFLLFLLDAINVNKYLHSSIKYANY